MRFYIFFLIFLFVQSFHAQDENKDVENHSQEKKDSLANRKLSFDGYPYAYYTPETELAFGVGGIIIFYTDNDIILLPSKTLLSGYYTTNNQYKITVDPEFYFSRNELYISAPVSFGHYENKFWGIGNKTSENGNENYTLNVFSASLSVQVPPLWFSSDRTGIVIDFDNTEISDKKNNEFLINNDVSGSKGGKIFGLGSELIWDSRDELFFPNSGNYQYFKLIIYPDLGDYIFYTMEMDVKHFSSFSKDQVFAGNFYFAAASEGAPFYKLPALGGQKRMRGYYEGRYRDNVYMAVQVEYRQYFWRRLGFVVFAGVGDVTYDLMKFKIDNFKYSYGAGLRFLFNREQKVNLRMDIGFGKKGNSGIYFGIEEAF